MQVVQKFHSAVTLVRRAKAILVCVCLYFSAFCRYNEETKRFLVSVEALRFSFRGICVKSRPLCLFVRVARARRASRWKTSSRLDVAECYCGTDAAQQPATSSNSDFHRVLPARL